MVRLGHRRRLGNWVDAELNLTRTLVVTVKVNVFFCKTVIWGDRGSHRLAEPELRCTSLSTRWQHRTDNSQSQQLLSTHRSCIVWRNAPVQGTVRMHTFFLWHVKRCFLFVNILKTSLAQRTGSFKPLHLMICHVIWEAFADSAVLCSSKGGECSVYKEKKKKRKEYRTLLCVERRKRWWF